MIILHFFAIVGLFSIIIEFVKWYKGYMFSRAWKKAIMPILDNIRNGGND